MKSPLGNHKQCELIQTFDPKIIVDKYESDININVKRFFENIEKVELWQCTETGYRFYAPFSVIGDENFYKEIATVRNRYYWERWEHRKTLALINKQDQILEIGSGFGAFLELLNSKGYSDVKGLELSSLAVNHCMEKGLNVEHKMIQEIAKSTTKYDVVCSFQVLEHVADVKSFLEASISSLNVGGRLIIGVPNNTPFLHGNDKYHTLNLPPHHAGLWNDQSLKALTKFLDIEFSSISFEPLSESIEDYVNSQIINSSSKLRRLIFKAGKKYIRKQFYKFLPTLINGRNVLIVYIKT